MADSQKATNLNEEILNEDPDSLAVDADEDVQYEPFPDEKSSVVVTEPMIITIGRVKRKNALRSLPPEQQ